MAVQPDDFLFYRENLLIADAFSLWINPKFTLHLGASIKEVNNELTVDDLDEAEDDNYTPIEIEDWDIEPQDNGLVCLVKRDVAFDFGAGPAEDITTDYVWIEFEADGMPSQVVSAFNLPLAVTIDADHPKLTLDFCLTFGALDEDKFIGAEDN